MYTLIYFWARLWMFSCTHSFFIALFCPQYNFISMQQYPALASFTWVRHWNRVYGAFTRRRSISGAYPACDGVPKSCLGILSMPKAWRWGTWLLGDQCWCATWLYEEINSCTSTKKKVFILLKICTSASFIRRGWYLFVLPFLMRLQPWVHVRWLC